MGKSISPTTASSGVIQGPLFFNVFIADLPTSEEPRLNQVRGRRFAFATCNESADALQWDLEAVQLDVAMTVCRSAPKSAH
jgi:hypothetical protein